MNCPCCGQALAEWFNSKFKCLRMHVFTSNRIANERIVILEKDPDDKWPSGSVFSWDMSDIVGDKELKVGQTYKVVQSGVHLYQHAVKLVGDAVGAKSTPIPLNNAVVYLGVDDRGHKVKLGSEIGNLAREESNTLCIPAGMSALEG